MKFIVLRHGLTELNKKKILNGQIDEPLAIEGIEQAKKAVSKLPKSIKHIYVSPLLRARQTAEILNSKLHLPVSIVSNLKEIHMGTLAGKAWTDLENGLKLKKEHRSIQFDYQKIGGETANDVKKRVIEFLKKIHNEHKDDEALLVTHGGILRVLHLLEHKKEILDDIKNASIHIFNTKKIII